MAKKHNEVLKFDWGKYRNRWVYLNKKKLKLRHYMSVQGNVMKKLNKAEWQGVDHFHNYKIALSRYGLDGLKHYENRFYHNIPMPYDRGWWLKVKLWFLGVVIKIKKKF